MNTEEAFVLASLKEFVGIWGSGNQASFYLECRNGQAFIKMESKLENPASQHVSPHHIPRHNQHQGPHGAGRLHPRHKCPGQVRRDTGAAAHRATTTNQPDNQEAVTALNRPADTVDEIATAPVEIIKPDHPPPSNQPRSRSSPPAAPTGSPSETRNNLHTATTVESTSTEAVSAVQTTGQEKVSVVDSTSNQGKEIEQENAIEAQENDETEPMKKM